MVGLLTTSYSSAFAFDAKPSVRFGTITRIGRQYSIDDKNKDKNTRSETYYRFGPLLEHDIGVRHVDRRLPMGRESPATIAFNERPNAGVTGGVLVDLDGHMVGLTTATAGVHDGEIGPGYSIPIDENVLKIVKILRKGEEVEYGFLGITLGNPTPVTVGKVSRHSPAEIVGIQSGDVITHINDVPVDNYPDLLLNAGCALAGTTVKLTILRRGYALYPNMTLAKFKNEQTYIASVRPEPVFGLRVDYLSILTQALDPRVQSPFQSAPIKGVGIREITANSPAADKFKKLGDNHSSLVITHLNGTPVANPGDFYKAAKGQSSVNLTIRELDANADVLPTIHELTLP
jgi:serine protease Do